MPQPVTDFRSNVNDQIAFGAKAIGRQGQRRRVFEAIYRGKRGAKTVRELAAATGLSRKQVLTAGLQLAQAHLVEQDRQNGETAYKKDLAISGIRNKIISLADNPERLRHLPTKVTPQVLLETHIQVAYPKPIVQVKQITVNEIDSFFGIEGVMPGRRIELSEAAFKAGVQSIIGERGTFTDWGGELNDLFTTRVLYQGSRVSAAFAFKGPGLRGRLTPARLGKNGDQLQRLFMTPADLFVVQYWGQVDQQVYADMRTFAVAKSVSHAAPILYAVIDGDDTSRIVAAFPDHFSTQK